MSVGYTPHRSVQVPGFASLCLLTPARRLHPLRVPRTSALLTASFRSPVARGTLAAQLTLPLAGCVEDFHLQMSAPCRAHKKTRPGGWRPRWWKLDANGQHMIGFGSTAKHAPGKRRCQFLDRAIYGQTFPTQAARNLFSAVPVLCLESRKTLYPDAYVIA
jgi:hypothetical protein